MMKKCFSLFITSILVFMLAVSPAMGEILPVEEASSRIEQMELERAVSYGLVTEEWLAVPDEWANYPEFCTMLSRLIELVDAEKTAEWEQLAQLGLVADEIMHRDDAALALYLAAQILGIDYYNIETYPDQQRVAANHASHLYDHDFPLWPQEALGGQAPWVYVVGTGTYGPMPESEYAMQTAFWFSLLRRSLVTEMPLLTWADDYDLHMNDGITRRDAALAAVRLLESEANLLDDNNYIHIDEVGSYDRSIITDELLSAPTELPEPVVDGKLTSEWKGAGTTLRKDGGHVYKDFQESDIAFLADQGFNFSRIFFGFSTLRFPENPENFMLVNESELQDLDQLIAWGIEYDIHIHIAMSFTPDGRNDSLNFNDEEWAQVCAYWKALARRYADIPSKYLSFDLFNEMEPAAEEMSRTVEKLSALVQDMHAYNDERLIFASYSSTYPNLTWVENLASIGISLGCHAYSPYPMFCGLIYEDGELAQEIDVAYWPYPYFPRVLDRGEEYTVEGEIGGQNMIIELLYAQNLTVDYDNGESFVIEISDGDRGNSCYMELTIPENVSRITFRVEDADFVEFNCLAIGHGAEADRLFPHDLVLDIDEGTAQLVWTEEDRWSSEKHYTAQDIVDDCIRPSLEIAEKYGVHLIVNEFGYFGGEATVEAVATYVQSMVQAMEANDISWCYCETEGWPYRYLSLPYDTEYELSGATLEPVYYVFESGQARKLKYCKELLDAFHGEYTEVNTTLDSKIYTDKETVKAVQTALNEAGFSCGTPDGVAGNKTIAAITNYQTSEGLTVTGTITHETLISMGLAN